MDKSTLVENVIKAGKELLDKLDKDGFDVKAALWYYLSEPAEWRLILASSTVDKEGPKKAYEKIQSQIRELEQHYKKTNEHFDLSLENISVVSPNNNLIKLIKSVIKTKKGVISNLRFTRNVINNVLIEDAYIYRIV